MKIRITIIIVFAALVIPALADDSSDLRFLCYEDRNECAVYADMLAQFTDESGMAIALETALESDIVAALADGLPADIVRLSDMAALNEMVAMVAESESAMGFAGRPDSLAVVAPFVNLSLFAEAGRGSAGRWRNRGKLGRVAGRAATGRRAHRRHIRAGGGQQRPSLCSDPP